MGLTQKRRWFKFAFAKAKVTGQGGVQNGLIL
jgi:hypothetical protein